MVESNAAEQWPTGGSLGSDDRARTQKILEVVIGSATAIALGVGCFFLGKFLLGGNTGKVEPRVALEKPTAPALAPRTDAATANPAAARSVAAATPAADASARPAPAADDVDTAEAFPGFERTLTAIDSPRTADRPATAARESASPASGAAGVPAPAASKTSKGQPTARNTAKTPARSDAKSTAVSGDSVSRPATKGSSSLRVDGVTVCRAVKNRMPEGAGSRFDASAGKIFCWVRVVNGQGRKIRHVWTIDGKRTTGVWLDVGSPWWRTWGSKKIDGSMRGNAKVEIESDDGRILGSATFRID